MAKPLNQGAMVFDHSMTKFFSRNFMQTIRNFRRASERRTTSQYGNSYRIARLSSPVKAPTNSRSSRKPFTRKSCAQRITRASELAYRYWSTGLPLGLVSTVSSSTGHEAVPASGQILCSGYGVGFARLYKCVTSRAASWQGLPSAV